MRRMRRFKVGKEGAENAIRFIQCAVPSFRELVLRFAMKRSVALEYVVAVHGYAEA